MIEESNQTGLEIAVIGMSGRFPGAKNIDEFWNNLRDGVESISFFSTRELAEIQVSPGLLSNPEYVKARGILEDIEYFDAVFFGYTPREAELMDPQMRMFHEIAWEALENAGYDPYSYDGLIGFYAGAAHNHYWEGLAAFSGKSAEVGNWTSYQLVDKDYMTMRISYTLNLIGPSFSMYTACSTSLVAIHLACQAILNGECDLALAGGITLMLPQKTGYLYREGMIMSPEGHCRAFDADAKGTITGSGAGVALLKRLEDAVADRDYIYAVVKGTAINNDGIRKSGFTAPSVEGQVEVIREAQQLAHVEPESISFVETHGTGTELGDPIEIKALTLAFDTPGRNFCALGSVKTNVGHLDAAAGAAGFIKTVLALTHRLIPPSLHFETPNPKIDFENSPFYVNTVPREWKSHQYPLRAGVSSFGIGGTNAHVVLEEAPAVNKSVNQWVSESVRKETEGREYQLILLSAKTAIALEQMTQNLGLHLKNKPGINLADAAYTLQVGRKALEYRRMFVCANIEEAIPGLTALESGSLQAARTSDQDERNAIFMFPGQGAQYVNMGRGLYENEPLFQQEMNRCFEILNGLLDYNIKDILYPDPDCRGGSPNPAGPVNSPLERGALQGRGVSKPATYNLHLSPDINQTEIAQPVLFIFEYALAKLLMHWGIKPYAMIGHSIGEYVAACLSGVFSLEDALTVVVSRGKLMQQMPTGAMLSIFVPEEELKPLLNKNNNISLAAVNGPRVCVVSGTHEAIDQFDLQAKAKGYKTRRLHTSHAFHSTMMEPILKPFAEVVGRVSLNKPKIPYISNLTGHWQAVEQAANPDYWTAHLRQTVRFADGISLLAKIKHPIFVEVGPGQALSTFARQLKQEKQETGPPVTNLVRHPKEEKSDTWFLLDRIGGLWLYDCKIDWKGFYRDERRQRTPLPTYPFQGQRYWIDEKSLTLLPGTTPGELLTEKNPDIGDWFYIPSWKRSILPMHPTGKRPDESLSGNRSHLLLFMDTCGLGEQLARRLAKDNAVTRVKPGPGFAHTHTKKDRKDDEYIINPAVPGDYDALLNDLRSNSQFPRRIVHLWNVTAPGTRFSNDDDSENNAFFSLLHLVQAIGKQNQDNSIHLAVVTGSMQEVTGEEILNPQKAMILGPLMVIPYEYPNIRCCAIDIVTPEPDSKKEKKLVDQLAAELTSHFPDRIIAFRGNYRLVQTFEPVHPGPVEDKVPCLREKGVYLITGGWGGIGLELAGYLAQTLRARLILVGRSIFPAREEWDHWLSTHPEQDRISRKILKIKALEEAGAEVLLLCADVADYQRMQQVIARAETCFGPINGVIHAAGVPGGGMIQLKKTETAKQVLAPKVKGTLVLDRLLNTKPLDFFLLCSSINSVLPRLGQVDYYAANAFMDAFAHYKTSGSGTFTVSINWDTWQQVGMAKEAAFRGLGARETDHPLLEYHINDGPGVDAYLTRLSFNRHWVLNEHMIPGKKGLLPGTAYLEMVRGAFPSHAGEVETGIEVRDVQFLTPLVVPEGEDTDAALILKKQEKGFDFPVVSRSPGKENGQSSQRNHAVGKVSVLDSQQDQAPKIHDIKRIKTLCSQEERIREQKEYRESQQSGLLVFGPRWGTVKRVNYGKNQALAYLELDDAYTGDLQWYKLHPSLLDAAAAFLYTYINNTSAYIPYAYKRLTLVKDLPSRIFSYSRWLENNNPGKEFLTFNITLMDENGVELAEIEEFTMMEVSQAVKERIFGAISRTPGLAADAPGGNDSGDLETGIFDRWDQQLEFLQKGLQPEEGIEVLKRILALPAVMPQVVVSTVDLAARIKADAPGTRGLAARGLTKTNKTPRPTNPRPELRSLYAAPKNETELRITGLWQEILGIDKIGINDDFFELGGDSLKAISVGGRIHKASNVNVPLAEFFNRPTVKQLAQYITGHAQKTGFFSIEPVEKKEYYVLSSAQQRLYILHQMDPASLGYNLTEAVALEGEINKEKMEAIFCQLTARHESFRTSFEMVNNEPIQRIHDQVEFEIKFYDISEVEEEEQTTDDRTQTTEDRPGTHLSSGFIRPFDLTRPPLMRVSLIKQAEKKHILILDVHHIIHDGTSQTIFFKEFMMLYSPGGEELPRLTIQYKDYAEWWSRGKGNEVIKKQAQYWKKEFETDVPILNLPLDYPRPAVQSYDGHTIRFKLGPREAKGLKTLARTQEATLFMIILSIYYAMLSKLSSQEDIVVGTPTAGRKHPELHPIIGMFLNTLAIRNQPAEHKTFSSFLREVKDMTLQAFENQGYPFEDLVEQAAVNRDLSRSPLFDVMFILHNELQPRPGPITETARKDLKLKPYEYEKTTSQFDLTLIGYEGENHLLFKVEYCTKLFKEESVRRFINYFKEIVSLVLMNPEIKLSAIEIILEEEKNQILYDFNKTEITYPKDKTLHELFHEQAERTPDHVALVGKEEGWKGRRVEGKKEEEPFGQVLNAFGEGHLSYKELNKRSDQLAWVLIEKGVKPGSIVGIMVERSGGMIAGLLGILKAGAAYLPIDPNFPVERIDFMLTASNVGVLVTTPKLQVKVKAETEGEEKERIVNIETLSNSTSTLTSTCQVSPTNLAYVIYTSGSTGNPKGVAVTHVNAINFITGMTGIIDFSPGKTLLALTTISFDIFFLEILLPLTAGLKVVIADESQQKDPVLLQKLIVDNRVNMVQVTPSRLQLLLDSPGGWQGFHRVRELLVGGEAFPPALFKQLKEMFPGKIYNVYGPTETTIWSTVKDLTDCPVEALNIGRPIANTQIYIVNRYMQVQPLGIAGELLIGGDGVANGYLNNPELTAEKFVNYKPNDIHAFMQSCSHATMQSPPHHSPQYPITTLPHYPIYLTGDLACWLDNGEIQCMGRMDQQVKVRGYRIELEEIEEQLVKHRHIKEAVVTAKTNKSGEKILYAYFLPELLEEGEIDVSELRKMLALHLPDYMIPSYFVQLEQMPLTPNGKIDRKSLPEPGESRPRLESTYLEPKTQMEKIIAGIWQEELGLEKIGLNDNFFDLGGNSMNVVRFISRLNDMFKKSLPVVSMFKYRTIRTFSHYLEDKEKGNLSIDDRSGALKRGERDRRRMFEIRKGSHVQ